MTKSEFLKELESKLSGLPQDDIDNRLEFYSEMIDDRVEEGKTEEQAIEEIGSVDEVVEGIAKETPMLKLVKERVKPKRSIKGWEIALIILGFPLWLPLVITFFVLVLVFYLLLWVLVIVTYAIEIALIAAFIYGIVCYIASGFNVAFLAIALLSIGVAFFMVFACIGATKGSAALTKKVALSTKKKFMKGNK